MKKVSIIIPVYNTSDYLETSISSILNQTYKELEIIIINNGSNQETSDMLNYFKEKDNRIKVFNFSENKGVGLARNYGIEKATGKFLYFFDSDDYIESRTIELLVNIIKDNKIASGGIRTTHFSTSFAIIFDGLYETVKYTGNRFNLIKRNAAVNFLYDREFVIGGGYKFSEEVEIYSDLKFIIPIFNEVKYIEHLKEALYFRRKRNDPIKNPSLDQRSEMEKIENFLKVFLEIKNEKLNQETTEFINHQMLNYYRQNIILEVSDSEKLKVLSENLIQVMKSIDLTQLKSYDRLLRRELRPLLKKDLKKYSKRLKRHNLLRDIKGVIFGKDRMEILKSFVYERILLKFPIKSNLVFLESFGGKGYSDNPKYIYEEMLKQGLNMKYVWSVEKDEDIPGKHKQIKPQGIKYYYYLARAKYIIVNARLPRRFLKRNDSIYLQTWHGTPLKRLAGDMEEVHMPGTNTEKYKRNFYNETQKWDYLIAPNAYSEEIFKRAFWFDKTFLRTGYPRNDLLYTKNNEESIIQLKKQMNLPLDKKVILYAPTWRDDEYYSVGNYKFDLKLDLQQMQKYLGKEYVIVLRMHYLIASKLNISQYKGFVYDYSMHNDIGELYLISDLLITDYSSVFFDYANLKRPVLFYTYDIKKYSSQLRGFYLDMYADLPGPLLNSSEEVIKSILKIDEVEKKYSAAYSDFYKKICSWENGAASKEIVSQVIKGDE